MRPRKPIPAGLTVVFQCPYCPRGRGIIAVDADFVARTLDEHGTADVAAQHLSRDGRDGLLVFDPDGASGGPCEHLISYLIDADLIEYRDGEPVERGGALSGSWDHSWFTVADPQQILQEYLWTDVNGGDDTGFHPVLPHRIEPVGERRQFPASTWSVDIGGTVIVALAPDTFFEQLHQGFWRMQAFYEQQRGSR